MATKVYTLFIIALSLVRISAFATVSPDIAFLHHRHQRRNQGKLKVSTDHGIERQLIDYEENDPSVAALRSVTFCNVAKSEEPELLCDFLMELGACSTSTTDADSGTPLEQPLFGEPGSNGDPWKDSLNWAAPIWNRCNVTAHFPASIDLQGVVDLIASVFPDQYPLEEYAVDQVPELDWVIHVQQNWKPIVIRSYVLSFPWHEEHDIATAIEKHGGGTEDQFIELKLQGGVAFGTGEHPTTHLCLEWIEQQVTSLMETNDPSTTIDIMDYGTGSGVLGLAACALSKRVKAYGVDIDVDAIQIANANAALNNLPMTSFLPPLADTTDNESKSLLLKAHAHAQKQLADRTESFNAPLVLPTDLAKPIYDVCVANILAGPLVALSSTMASLVKPGGALGMSGILANQEEMVISAYSRDFHELKCEKEMGGWILITGKRKSN